MADLTGKVVALICRGSEEDRAIAVALAEAGADLALGTVSKAKDEEFSTASIANEVWAIGREQMNSVIDAADPEQAAAFAAEVADRLRRCDAVIVAAGPVPRVPVDQLSRDEWDIFVREGLTAPLMSVLAFARVIERGGGGALIVVIDGAIYGDVGGAMVAEALRAMAANMGMGWRDRKLRALSVSREGAPEQIISALG